MISGLAAGVNPTVYGGGVLGHDHLLAAPPNGAGFETKCEPVVVLFNTRQAVTHVTTVEQLEDLDRAGAITEIPLPPATLHCSVVPATVYDRGVPFRP